MLVAGKGDVDVHFDENRFERQAQSAGTRPVPARRVERMVKEHDLPVGSRLGELLSQGKTNIQAPWLGLDGFFSVAIMLSLLIFIGEAVRDAFDPRKTFR